jgi:hypothetical protein
MLVSLPDVGSGNVDIDSKYTAKSMPLLFNHIISDVPKRVRSFHIANEVGNGSFEVNVESTGTDRLGLDYISK